MNKNLYEARQDVIANKYKKPENYVLAVEANVIDIGGPC